MAVRIRNEAADNWDDRVAVERFEGKGGKFIRGSGRLIDAHTVEVDGDGGGDPGNVICDRSRNCRWRTRCGSNRLEALKHVDTF